MRDTVNKWLHELHRPGAPDEFEVKALFRAFGIPCPKGLRIRPDDAPDLTTLAPPLAVKVCSGAILHKTEQGGVILSRDLSSAPEAIAELRQKFPGEAVLVEEMARFTEPEILVGALRDSTLGIAVLAGAGGILTEIYNDAACRLAPLTPYEAATMLDDLAIAPVFSGFRKLPHDKQALARLISRVGEMVLALGERFEQLDINPLVFAKNGSWIALDGMLVLRPA